MSKVIYFVVLRFSQNGCSCRKSAFTLLFLFIYFSIHKLSMAPGAKQKSFNPRREITFFLNKYCTTSYVKSLILEPAKLPIVSVAIIICELILNIFIVQRVRYTEIDWIAYMQECEGFLNGTTNYALLKGMYVVYRSEMKSAHATSMYCEAPQPLMCVF